METKLTKFKMKGKDYGRLQLDNGSIIIARKKNIYERWIEPLFRI